MATYTVHEKRRHARVNIALDAVARITNQGKGVASLKTRATNISLEGLRIECGDKIPLGATVSLAIAPHRRGAVPIANLTAQVVWTRRLGLGDPYSIGAHIISGEDPKALAAWRSFVQAHAERTDTPR